MTHNPPLAALLGNACIFKNIFIPVTLSGYQDVSPGYQGQPTVLYERIRVGLFESWLTVNPGLNVK